MAEKPPSRPKSQDANGFLIEFIAMGNAVKVSAIDPVSGVETSIIGAASASQHDLMVLAAKKLRYVLNKAAAASTPPPAAPTGGKKGIIA
ncbi:MAG: hypothetical protein Tsb0016_16130 [Sphingomonadales bacterium]